MADRPLLVATRSAHKLEEIRRILPAVALESLAEAGIEALEEEEGIETAPTFLGNAILKARYFAGRAGRPVLADDSGLRVAALDGRPGVRTKRLARDEGTLEEPVDEANNRTLLRLLEGLPPEERGAYYVCAAVLACPDSRLRSAIGVCAGRIGREPRGSGGFGYDPLFELPDGRVMAEVSPEVKDRISHRGLALRALHSAGLDRP